MLPTPERLRADRLIALIQAALAALAVAVAVAFLAPIPAAGTAGAVAAPVVAAGVYRWATRRWRRRRRLLARPFPEGWRAVLERRVAFYRALPEAERRRFEGLVRVFLAEVPVHGVGCPLDDEDRLLVAAGAVIPILGFPAWEYEGLEQVLVRPEAFDATFREGDEDDRMASGLVHAEGLLGGTLVLSLPELRAGFADERDGHNVAIHEFAHLVDRGSGALDGIPALIPPGCVEPWLRLVRRELAERGGDHALDDYAYTDEREFLAVASELFFENPERLAQRHPELYELLRKVYRR